MSWFSSGGDFAPKCGSGQNATPKPTGVQWFRLRKLQPNARPALARCPENKHAPQQQGAANPFRQGRVAFRIDSSFGFGLCGFEFRILLGGVVWRGAVGQRPCGRWHKMKRLGQSKQAAAVAVAAKRCFMALCVLCLRRTGRVCCSLLQAFCSQLNAALGNVTAVVTRRDCLARGMHAQRRCSRQAWGCLARLQTMCGRPSIRTGDASPKLIFQKNCAASQFNCQTANWRRFGVWAHATFACSARVRATACGAGL